ncbi:MAG TPA: chromate transporter [Acetobacteraceae bacterium]|nr:chromate transporter [Acetobacteraceae bacterium]
MPTPTPTQPGCGALFVAFAGIGLSGFGGVLPWARRHLVDRLGWLTGQDFTELLALAQLIPGPNIANLSVIYGRRLHGARGAAAALAGLYLAPTVIVLGLGLLAARWERTALVRDVFAGVMPVAAGLTLGTGLCLAAGLPRGVRMLLVVALSFAGAGLFAWPLWLVLAIAAPVSLALGRIWRAGPEHGAP